VNIVFVSHCDFRGNSAMHIFSIAQELEGMGVDAVVCVPNQPATVFDHGNPCFQVLHHDRALDGPIVFPDGRGPDLIHAWTTRELVRKLTEALSQRYEVPYVVHMEDNEEVIVEDELGVSFAELAGLPPSLLDELIEPHRSHPLQYPRFLAGAAGMTALMDRLLEFKPEKVPGTVFWAGFDSAFAEARPDPGLRDRLGLESADLVVVYTGNVHHSNVAEVGSLVLAVAALRRRGHPLVLVKSGWNFAEIPYFEEGKRQGFIVDVGFCVRGDVPKLIAVADVLVQPGGAGEFNDYRFPSKIPEFLVSGKPVLLPRTNIGRFLQDDIDCVLLGKGDALEIADTLEPLLGDPERRRRIGEGGRRFALQELNWTKNVARIREFYDQVLSDDAHTEAGVGSERPSSGRTRTDEAASEGQAGDGWRARIIAFYLPQFHRIKENDEWWGEGFTEWTNVARAEPSFSGHQQPLEPSELGFYDLQHPEVQDRQAELARAHGIHGFCYYYYWFNGRLLLERPLQQMLARGRPDFPFCICWANENWTRRWDGSEDEILLAQDYAEGYAQALIDDVIPILKDPRYITVKGAPILLVYRVDLLPDAAAAAQCWRQRCAMAGIPEIHLAAVQSFGITDPRAYGFDAAVEFPPHNGFQPLDPDSVPGLRPDFRGHLEDYRAVAERQLTEPLAPYVRYRGVMPAWDNTPRRMRTAHVYLNASPEAYHAWLRRAVEATMARSAAQEPLVFVNAWNEWGEGAFLEPDTVNGTARLEATRRALYKGMTDHFRRRGVPASEEMLKRALTLEGAIGATEPQA
jgi:glycosyltransferase involved in cell wall biosynthesis